MMTLLHVLKSKRYKIRLHHKSDEVKVIDIFLKSGEPVGFGKDYWSFNLPSTLEAIKKSDISFELIKPKEEK